MFHCSYGESESTQLLRCSAVTNDEEKVPVLVLEKVPSEGS